MALPWWEASCRKALPWGHLVNGLLVGAAKVGDGVVGATVMGDFVGSGGVLGVGVIGHWEDLILGGKEGDGEGHCVGFLLGAAVVGDSVVGTAIEGGGEGLRVGIADGGKDGGGEGRCVGDLDEGSTVVGDSRVTSSSSTKHGFTRKLPSSSSSSSPVS